MTDQEQKQPPPSKKPLHFIRCQASQRCEGNQARLDFKKKLASGGHAYRYTCLTCNKAWHISL